MLKIQYYIKFGFLPNFKSPKRFSEKIQLYKMYYRNPILYKCVDKYEVRRYIENKGLANILNELYGMYHSAEEIKWEDLPQEFVIKSTTGGGGLNVIIVPNKSGLDINKTKKIINSWAKHEKGKISSGREWAYNNINENRIIIEKYLKNNSEEEELTDYKFFCFNGVPQCIQVDSGRFNSHHQNYYNMDWESLDVHCTYPSGPLQKKPENFEKMKEVARILSSDLPFVRVDLYNINGKIIFGELTFYPSSGYGKYHPDNFDFVLGNYFTKYK